MLAFYTPVTSAGWPCGTRVVGAACRKRNGLNAVSLEARDRGPDVLLHRAYHGMVLGRDQGIGLALALGSARAANAVGVGVRRVRHVKVNDVRHLLHVEAASRKIGRNENIELAVAKAVHGALALALGHIALQGNGTPSGSAELLRQAFGTVFGAGKDDGRDKLVVGKQALEDTDFLALVDRVQRMLNGRGGLGMGEFNHMRRL